jgi:hypothetical protein
MGRWWLAFSLVLAAPAALRGQDGSPRLTLTMPPRVVARTDAPTVSMADVLKEGHRRELLNSGWPAVLHCRVEVWKRGFLWTFGRESVVEWDLIVEYDPATRVYHVRRIQDRRIEELGAVGSIDEAEAIVDRPYRVPLTPRSSGGVYFYSFTMELSTLSLSDLDAWQRWVRGEARPALQGKRSPATALQKGLGSMLSRVLGGETQTYERKSGTFKAG